MEEQSIISVKDDYKILKFSRLVDSMQHKKYRRIKMFEEISRYTLNLIFCWTLPVR